MNHRVLLRLRPQVPSWVPPRRPRQRCSGLRRTCRRPTFRLRPASTNGSAGDLKLHLKALTAAWDRFGAQFSDDNDSGFSAIGRLCAAGVA